MVEICKRFNCLCYDAEAFFDDILGSCDGLCNICENCEIENPDI